MSLTLLPGDLEGSGIDHERLLHQMTLNPPSCPLKCSRGLWDTCAWCRVPGHNRSQSFYSHNNHSNTKFSWVLATFSLKFGPLWCLDSAHHGHGICTPGWSQVSRSLLSDACVWRYQSSFLSSHIWCDVDDGLFCQLAVKEPHLSRCERISWCHLTWAACCALGVGQPGQKTGPK